MPRRFGPAALALVLGTLTGAARPGAARQPLPPSVVPPGPAPVETRLPRAEEWQSIDPRTVRVVRVSGSWQVYANGTPFRDLGDAADAANDVARVLRELHV